MNLYGVYIEENEKTLLFEIIRIALSNSMIPYSYDRESEVLVFYTNNYILMKHVQKLSRKYPNSAIVFLELNFDHPQIEKTFIICNGKLIVKQKKSSFLLTKVLNEKKNIFLSKEKDN